ncbi:MAG: MFS transporter [Rubrobacter sp.]|nr:MFS transporter [Rubrobacter sp.]
MDPEEQALPRREISLLVVSAFFTMIGFYLLLSVVPLYTERAGGGSTGAGLATAVFMLATVLAQVQMPRMLVRFGYRAILAAGTLFLGLPAFVYLLATEVPSILAVTLFRGAGFGVAIVVLAALVVEFAPPERRGEALGWLGVALTLPAVFGSALGVWMVERAGFVPVFAIGGAAPLFGFLFALAIRDPAPDRQEERSGGFLSGLGRGPLLRVFLIFASCTLAAGVFVTFLPLAEPGSGLFSATTALLSYGLASTLGRFWAGRFSDRNGPHRLLVPALLSAALGMTALSVGGAYLLLGGLLFGGGFGVLQSATLILVMSRVSKGEYGLGSTLWNVAFDGGIGLGAFAFGFVVGGMGFSAAFLLSGALMLAALVLVSLDHARRPA